MADESILAATALDSAETAGGAVAPGPSVADAAAPLFVVLSDLGPGSRDWQRAQHETEELAEECVPAMGFRPAIRLVSLPSRGIAVPTNGAAEPMLSSQLSALAGQGSRELFLFPASFEFGLWDRERVAEAMADLRRRMPSAFFHYDDIDSCDPMIVQAFADAGARDLPFSASQAKLGVLLVASGDSDPGARAQAYRLMRLLWEQLGAAQGEVAFLRHPAPFFREALEKTAAGRLCWVVVPLMQWDGESLDRLRVILNDHLRAHPEAAARYHLASPPGAHPCLRGWLRQRLLRLWSEKRRVERQRQSSKKSGTRGHPRRLGSHPRDGIVAEVRDAAELRALLPGEILDAPHVFVKVTWHGYAPGTFTDALALDALLAALPGRVALLEGHTVSRNLGPVDWDWETDARQHRRWIREQEAEYLRRTGLAEVIQRRHARYVNVTECFWDGQCAPQLEVERQLRQRNVELSHPRLAGFLPQALLEHAGAPVLSFARFKGPTRLSLSNLFGLIPDPLRSGWHGPNITYMAQVCCDVARLYGTFFPIYGMVEGIFSAVRWDRSGLYRSRWGNYDLIANPGLAVVSEGLAAADVLASRLQGQDVRRSAFFDVVARELGLPGEACERSLPQEWVQMLA